jgi:flagellar biosynthesis protein FlhF
MAAGVASLPAGAPPPGGAPAGGPANPEWRRIRPAPWVEAARAKPAAVAPMPTSVGPVARALAAHGLPGPLIGRILAEPANTIESLAARLATEFRFASLADRRSQSPILLAGPPGSGKTLTVAKLAARAVMEGRAAHILTTDTMNAGGIERLATFARALQAGLGVAQRASDLPRLLDEVRPGALVLIDTPSANPFTPTELGPLAEAIMAVGAEACLTLPVGIDAGEAADIAQAFGAIGCVRLIPTRIDAARRLGAVFAAAAGAELTIAEGGVAPLAADGLAALTPRFLAERLLASFPGGG